MRNSSQRGVLVLAQITGISDTSWFVNDQQMIKVNLHFEVPGYQGFDTQETMASSPTRMQILNAHKLVALVEPGTQKYEIDWNASALIAGVVPAQFTLAEDNKTYDLRGQAGPLMEIMQILRANNVPMNGTIDIRSNPAVRQQVMAVVRRAAAGQPAASAPAAPPRWPRRMCRRRCRRCRKPPRRNGCRSSRRCAPPVRSPRLSTPRSGSRSSPTSKGGGVVMASESASYGVHSEVGTLRKVLVCSPGLAHERLTPTNCDDLLFDDVLWVQNARRDHFDFIDKMRDRGVDVVELHNLLAETMDIPEARTWLLDRKIVANEVGLGLVDETRNFLDELACPAAD